MPLTSDGRLVDQTPLSTQTVDVVQHAPPLYGEHILDQLYADMDQSGIMTPAPQSGMNTPFYSLSRAGSHENLTSLNEVAHLNGAVPAAVLSSRLQNLNTSSRNNSFRRLQGNSGSNTPHSQPPHPTDEPSYFDNNHSSSHSNPNSNALSRRTSEEDNNGASQVTSGQHTPEHIDYSEMGDLNKVPSYRTAINAPIRGMSYTEGLPNYESAVSAPPSPERQFSQPGTPAEHPDYIRRNPLSSMGFTPIHPPAPVHTGDMDERRRLHVLQNRGRAH